MVGTRVVVRSIVPDEIGPTGGPAFTDVLGVLETWVDGVLSIRTAEGALVEVPQHLVVSGKPVPPRPSRFSRLSDDEVEHRCMAFSRPVEMMELGDWELRFLGGINPFANAALLTGDPGLPFEEALGVVGEFYTRHERKPVARVVAGSSAEQRLIERNWSAPWTDNEVHLAGVAALARRFVDVDIAAVAHEDHLTREWLVGNDRAQANFEVVAHSLDLRNATFASISEAGHQVARARVHVENSWAYLADLMIAPPHRRRGLAQIMMAATTQWAAERGASVMALQVLADNEAALALYADLGFERHHAYRYLTPASGVDN